MRKHFKIVIPEIVIQPYGNPYTKKFYCRHTDIKSIRKYAFQCLDGLHNFTKWGNVETYIDGMKVRTVSFQIIDENENVVFSGDVSFDICGSVLTQP
jgi:hypothetical protein